MRIKDPTTLKSSIDQAKDLIRSKRRVRGLLDLYGRRVMQDAVERHGGVAAVAKRYDVPMTRVSAVKNGRERISLALFVRVAEDLRRRLPQAP